MTQQRQTLHLDQPVVYEIRVQGRLDATWSDWFDDMTITISGGDGGPPVTTLTGPVKDQVALFGLLARIRDLGLPLLLVQWVDSPQRIPLADVNPGSE